MGCLPVQTFLRGRGLHLNPPCPLCNKKPETIAHALVLCSTVTLHYGSNNIDVSPLHASSYVDILFIALNQLSQEKENDLGTISWTIWKQRNAKVWSSYMPPFTTSVQQRLIYANDHQIRANHLGGSNVQP